MRNEYVCFSVLLLNFILSHFGGEMNLFEKWPVVGSFTVNGGTEISCHLFVFRPFLNYKLRYFLVSSFWRRYTAVIMRALVQTCVEYNIFQPFNNTLFART